jgi:hypothetical protein
MFQVPDNNWRSLKIAVVAFILIELTGHLLVG